MKKKLLSVIAASAVLVGITSCTKEKSVSYNENEGFGNMALTISWEQIENDSESRAATSTDVIPITTWANNIKDMKLVFVQSGTVKSIRDLAIYSSVTTNAQQSQLVNDIATGSYDIYLIANSGATATPFGNGSVSPSANIGQSLVGTSFASLLLNLVSATSLVGTDASAVSAYNEPSEIFLAKASGVAITSGGTTPTTMSLSRGVSLLRVRINKYYDSNSTNYDNSGVSFTTSGQVATRLRYHGTGIMVSTAAGSTTAPYGINGITTSAAVASNVLYSGKVYKTVSDFVAANYKSGANMGLATTDYTLWNEFLILPGGSSTVSDLKFNIALTGLAPAGYVAVDSATGAQTPLPTGGLVHWVGQVKTGAVKPNQIMELNLHLTTPGQTGPIPTPGQYGNLNVTLNLLDWDTTTVYESIEL